MQIFRHRYQGPSLEAAPYCKCLFLICEVAYARPQAPQCSQGQPDKSAQAFRPRPSAKRASSDCTCRQRLRFLGRGGPLAQRTVEQAKPTPPAVHAALAKRFSHDQDSNRAPPSHGLQATAFGGFLQSHGGRQQRGEEKRSANRLRKQPSCARIAKRRIHSKIKVDQKSFVPAAG